MTNLKSSNLPVPKHHKEALAALVTKLGESKVARAVGLSRIGIYPCPCRAVTAGTRALLREAFDQGTARVSS